MINVNEYMENSLDVNDLTTKLYLIVSPFMNQLRPQNPTTFECQDGKSRPVVQRVSFAIIKLRTVDFGKRSSVYTIPITVVVGKRRYLQTMQMAGDDTYSGVDGIVVGGVDARPVPVLDDAVLGGPDRPGKLPGWKMVLQLEPMHFPVLGSLGRQLISKARIVIAPGEQQLAVVSGGLGRLLNLTKVGLHRLEFFDYRWGLGPTQRVMPADAGPVKGVAVRDYGVRFQFLNGPKQTTVCGGVFARPKVSVTKNDYGLVKYA